MGRYWDWASSKPWIWPCMVAKLLSLPALLCLSLRCQGQLFSFAQLRGRASSPTPTPPEPGLQHPLIKGQADPVYPSATATTGKGQSHPSCSHAIRLTVPYSILHPHHQGQLYHSAQVKHWCQPSQSHANRVSSPMLPRQGTGTAPPCTCHLNSSTNCYTNKGWASTAQSFDISMALGGSPD